VHDLEIYCLDGVVSIEGVRVVSSLSYFHFVSYGMMLAFFCTIDLDRGRLSSYVLSWVWSGVSLDVGSVWLRC
jgi:hypothetical protein